MNQGKSLIETRSLIDVKNEPGLLPTAKDVIQACLEGKQVEAFYQGQWERASMIMNKVESMETALHNAMVLADVYRVRPQARTLWAVYVDGKWFNGYGSRREAEVHRGENTEIVEFKEALHPTTPDQTAMTD